MRWIVTVEVVTQQFFEVEAYSYAEAIDLYKEGTLVDEEVLEVHPKWAEELDE